MDRPDDIEWCCGAICDSTRKQEYIAYLESRVIQLETQIKGTASEHSSKSPDAEVQQKRSHTC